jgi:hypothetical protein
VAISNKLVTEQSKPRLIKGFTMNNEAPVHRRCGGELVQKSYIKDGQRLIWGSFLMLPFVLFGAVLVLIPFVIMIVMGNRLKKNKPEEYYTCKKCYLKIEAEDLDSKIALK